MSFRLATTQRISYDLLNNEYLTSTERRAAEEPGLLLGHWNMLKSALRRCRARMNNTTGCRGSGAPSTKDRAKTLCPKNHVERENAQPRLRDEQILQLLHFDLFLSTERLKTNKRHRGPALQNEYANLFQKLHASVYQHKAQR
ncbi:unnamed protein product [Tetraodon nigroviridis]|uniref:Chromosome 2 SCAF14781, whole genome shotgun sequence n=1 Tax=Tetraodon nigroviridis TaxID=99883 RepID=Q4S0L5_TETNG|nr:unnamed protein product [Tetraodon nigroviridis]